MAPVADDGARCDVVLAAHVPLLRIDADSMPFAGGDLWRMPFEAFDQLTMGAFEDHRAKYEAVAPVFYREMVRPRLDNLEPLPESNGRSARLQLKWSNDEWPALSQIGLDLVHRFHMLAADAAWLALLLEAPAAAFPQPRWSVTFVVADEGWGFVLPDHHCRIVSVQGDADMEYLMAPAFAGSPLPAPVLARASARADALRRDGPHPALVPALAALAHGSSPLLLPSDQTTLTTVALEGLLLPEVRSGLARTLGSRLASLLGADADERRSLKSLGRALYDTRSASLHGEALPADAGALLRDGAAARLLARAATELQARSQREGRDVAALLPRLDGAPTTAPMQPASEAGTTPVRRRQPLQDDRVSIVAMVGTALESEDDDFLMWAPLVGLRTTDTFAFVDGEGPLVIPLSGHELMLLEERDIARDFAARVRLVPEDIPALALRVANAEVADEREAVAVLERQRDLAVVALRLAGFHDFPDPSLAGSVVVQRSLRFRHPAVLRQSVWQMLLRPAERPALGAADAVRIGPAWRLLQRYEASPRHPDIERGLSLFRRTFDLRFAALESIAALQFALMETLLGRFRRPGSVVQLEDLVGRLLGAGHAGAAWFTRQARQARNDVAHGRGSDAIGDEGHAAMTAIACAALPAAIERWLDAAMPDQRPGDVLVEALERQRGSDPAPLPVTAPGPGVPAPP